jgi:hypothetical protein
LGLAVHVWYMVHLVNSVSALCTAEGGVLSDHCALFMLYCQGHQCGISYVCRDDHLLHWYINIYYSHTEYTDELTECKVADWTITTILLFLRIITHTLHHYYIFLSLYLLV